MTKKQYQVFVNGDNFLIELDGKGLKKVGFYTTRCVEAKDPDEAEDRAVAMLRSDPKLKKWTRNKKNDPPLLHVNKIEECVLSKKELKEQLGLVFYAEDNGLKDGEIVINGIE